MAPPQSSSTSFSTSSGAPKLRSHAPRDVAVIGAGPVGLACAIELSRLGLSVVVLERRRPPTAGSKAGRPQLLVARPGDLANLQWLGIDVSDRELVCPLSTVENAGRCQDVTTSLVGPRVSIDALGNQGPVALVPISRLEQRLATIARQVGVELRYQHHAVRLRRHAKAASIGIRNAEPVRAHLVLIATGASRSVASSYGVFRLEDRCPPQTLMGGVFAEGGESGRWFRDLVGVRGVRGFVHFTLLQTPTESAGGTSLLVSARDAEDGTLSTAFNALADRFGLRDVVIPPAVFTTKVAAASSRFVARDNRAPIVVVGDAAQTGHVFAGRTCFINLALALELTGGFRKKAVNAVREGLYGDKSLIGTLIRYEDASDRATQLLKNHSLDFYPEAQHVDVSRHGARVA